MRAGALLLLCATAALAQETAPEPGTVPVSIVHLERLVVAPQEGDARAALATFLAAHEKHEEGSVDEALAGYLRFLGMPGRHDLPGRYARTVEERVAPLLKNVRTRYERALSLYARDRAKGIAELTLIAGRYAQLPEGRAARQLWHSDRLKDEIRAARRATDKKAAVAALTRAIGRWAHARYLYEAKTLLVELGGPDLFEPGEREASGGADDGEDTDDGGGGIEISDDD